MKENSRAESVVGEWQYKTEHFTKHEHVKMRLVRFDHRTSMQAFPDIQYRVYLKFSDRVRIKYFEKSVSCDISHSLR